MTGQRLGPYEVLGKLGEGGMGEVYTAIDRRLDRTVAVKILSPALAADPAFRQRFEREAKTISQLAHPHICALHDIGEHDGTVFLVLEHLEGTTLAERLARGPLPVGEAMRVAAEIATALHEAHRRGIVHRDLKPGNVMLTRAGAKLLDFGLAKHSALTAPRGTQSAAATVGAPLTEHGTILGTFQYMAPEQIEGREADPRCDIWAFGCLLYEMVTGTPAFAGATTASVIGAILKDRPAPVSHRHPGAPPVLDRVIGKCLARDPEERWQSLRDVVDVMAWTAPAAPAESSSTASTSSSTTRLRMVAAAAVLAVLAGGAGWWLAARRPQNPAPVTRFAVGPPPGYRMWAGALRGSAISPDGRRLIFAALQDGSRPHLFLQEFEQLSAKVLPSTEGASHPFFSPDGGAIGFGSGGFLRVLSLSDHTLATLHKMGSIRGGTWLPDGTIVFAGIDIRGLWRVPAAGGPAVPLTSLAEGEAAHLWPEALPDGRAILFVVQRDSAPFFAIAGLDLESGARRVLVEDASSPQYLSTGHLIFRRAGTLHAVRLDRRSLSVSGPAVAVADEVLAAQSGSAHAAVAASGALAYVPAARGRDQCQLAWVDRRGRIERIATPPQAFQAPRLSPDGSRAAIDIHAPERGESDIWIYHFGRGTLTRFTAGATTEETALWSPDSQRIAFTTDRPQEGGRLVLWKRADGGGTESRLAVGHSHLHLLSWSPDGEVIALDNGNTGGDIWTLRVNDGSLTPWLSTPFVEREPAFSPDGRWLAYVSDESGREEIYVRAFSGPGGVWQLSTEGGREPRWTKNGHEIVYRSGDRMMAVPVAAAGDAFEAGRPAVLFEGRFQPVGSDATYDVTADGQRFLMLVPAFDDPGQVVVVQNWAREVAALFAAGSR